MVTTVFGRNPVPVSTILVHGGTTGWATVRVGVLGDRGAGEQVLGAGGPHGWVAGGGGGAGVGGGKGDPRRQRHGQHRDEESRRRSQGSVGTHASRAFGRDLVRGPGPYGWHSLV